MNLQLANTQEIQDGKSVGNLGEVFIRSVLAPFRSARALTFRLQVQ